MANTSSARKATRKIARKTEINKARRTLLRNSVRKVEEAIASGDPKVAMAAMWFTNEPPAVKSRASRIASPSSASKNTYAAITRRKFCINF